MYRVVLIIICGLCVFSSVFASNESELTGKGTTIGAVTYRNTRDIVNGVLSPLMSDSAFSSMKIERQKKLASVFNLTVKEYKKYLYYMNDTMDGYEYQHSMNPNMVLALHTKDKRKYYQYIKNTVIADHDSITRMLKVSNDYTRIAKEVYPNELPVMTPQMQAQAKNQLQAGDLAQLYCKVNSPDCSNLLSTILPRVIKSDGVSLDIFAVGNVTKNNIVSFAKRNAISPSVVRSRKVTLNYGSSAFTHLEKQAHKKLPLPFLLVRRNGMEIPVNLGDSK